MIQHAFPPNSQGIVPLHTNLIRREILASFHAFSFGSKRYLIDLNQKTFSSCYVLG